MKFVILSVLFILIADTYAFAQKDRDKIKIERIFGGYKYTQNGRELKMKQLVRTMKYDELAFPKIKSARFNNTLSVILGASGGLLVGWPIGTAISNGDPNWTLAYIGAGLIAISIPISIMGNKQAIKAVKIYNENLTKQAFQPHHPTLRFSVNASGLGLTLQF